MTSLGHHELQQLHAIADEARETFAENAHLVGTVMELHPALDCSRVQSASTRALLVDAVIDGATRQGMPRMRTSVDCCELGQYNPDSLHDRRFRVLQAKRLADGSLYVPANSQSGLIPVDGFPEQPPMYEIDQWVMAVVMAQHGLPEEILAAHIIGAERGSPGRLLFDEEIQLGSGHDTFPASFIPDDDDHLSWLDDDENDEDDGSAAA